jgi:glycosyltransferase involved in cell wall biosynthesis
MRIIHLTSNHSTNDVRIFLKECVTLAQSGYDVGFIAPTDAQPIRINDVEIIPVKKPKNRADRFVLGSWRILQKALSARGDAYHFHDPDLIPVGFVLHLLGKRVIYDVHEDVPKDILSKDWIPYWLRGWVSKAMACLEWIAGYLLDGIVAATPAIARRWPKRKTIIVQNFPFTEELVTEGALPYAQRPRHIVYLGGISTIRGIREMVEAMAYLPEELRARLILVGTFTPPELEAKVRMQEGWKHVEFLGWQDRTRVSELLANSQIGLVLYHPEPSHLEAQPNKLFEYMAAGITVVASDFPVWRGIVEGEKCGLTVDPLDSKAIAEAIQWLLEHPEEAEEMGKRGRKAVLEKYNWEREAEKLLEFYRKLLCA